jgi:hypothetical protein
MDGAMAIVWFNDEFLSEEDWSMKQFGIFFEHDLSARMRCVA